MTRRAFSLVELTVVVAILGIISALAIPRFAEASARRQLDAVSHRIMADLRHAQQHALARSQATTIVFDDPTESYVVNAPDPLGATTSYTVNLASPPFPCQIVGVTLPSSTATFSGNGLPTASGVVTIQSGRFRRSITVTVGIAAADPGTTVVVP